MIQPQSRSALAIIAVLVSIGPLSTDLYLPALPSMRAAFGASVETMQLTLSAFLWGFAIAQLLCGPLADRFGRKPVIAGGLALFVIASLLCTWAPTVPWLIAGRVLQAIGACVGPVLGRTMVRDIHGPERAAPVLAYLGGIMALAPAVGPILGSLLISVFPWQSVFYALSAFAILAAIVYHRLLPETLPPQYHQPIHLGRIARNFKHLLGDFGFMSFALTQSIVFAGLFSFISGAPFVFIEVLGVPEQVFGWLFLAMVAGYIGGSITSAKLDARWSSLTLLGFGSGVSGLSALGYFAMVYWQAYGVAGIVLMQAVYAYSVGIVMPNSLSGALREYPHMAGTASSLVGFLQMTIAALAGMAVGILHDDTPRIMCLFIGVMGVATVMIYWGMVRPSQRALVMHARNETG